ncbi:MAG: UDP-N-acetylmuramoyl-tripeptide--D-alanyl-D-alanine ligase [Clostridia bacterium]|nr:UDP-N-acetylmuramoyl-tripeptide--D-alanyl-D-alanine ligase [Clostridia bacterium]
MQRLDVADIVKATNGELICGEPDFVISGITIDSRKAGKNMLFVAIVGENNDGHDYIGNAFENGADAIITHRDIPKRDGKNIIKVRDTRTALGDIARFYKEKYNLPTVAVTGSVGKTTTKDMISSVLTMKYNTVKTQGNYNNDLGLPLTVFRLEHKHEALVLEMGMSHFGEIHYLASIAKPDIAVITNIGMSHIENLGSQENICRSKMQICDFFDENGILVINGDDKFLKQAHKGIKTITYGIENKNCDYVAENIRNLGINGTKFDVLIDGNKYTVEVKVAGVHNVYNALAAIAVGKAMGVKEEDIIEGIREFQLTGMRMEIKHFGDITVIDDCYNSAPDSIKAALLVLSDTDAKRKIAILGDVLEMGGFAENELYKIGENLPKIDRLITVGDIAKHIANGAKAKGFTDIKSFERIEEAIAFLNNEDLENDAILVKASRGMHFERIVKALEDR